MPVDTKHSVEYLVKFCWKVFGKVNSVIIIQNKTKIENQTSLRQAVTYLKF